MYIAVVDPHGALFRYLAVARAKGYETLVLTADEASCRRHEKQYNKIRTGDGTSQIDRLVVCSVTSAVAIAAALQPYRDRLAGLLPGNETSVAATFTAGAELGFDCAPAADAVTQQLKTEMKQRLLEHGVPTPRSRVAATFPEAESAWREFDRNCMVKMVDYRSSANVYQVTSLGQLEQAWDAIVKNEMDIEAPFELAKVAIVEEVAAGRELTAEGYRGTDDVVFLNFCEKVTTERFVVVDHFVPAELSPEERAVVEQAAGACVRALGVRNSVFHVELHLVDGRPYVIECASRMPGSEAVLDAIQWAHHYDLAEVGIDLCVGKPTTTQYTEPAGHYALLAIYAHESGSLSGISGFSEMHRRGGVRDWHLGAKLGDRIEKMTDFRHHYGTLVLEDATAAGLREKVRWVRANLRLTVQ